jgi:hypothetical protein
MQCRFHSRRVEEIAGFSRIFLTCTTATYYDAFHVTAIKVALRFCVLSCGPRGGHMNDCENPMDEQQPTSKVLSVPAMLQFSRFLETHPPGPPVVVGDLLENKVEGSLRSVILSRPELTLHCTNPRCDGLRVFRCVSGEITVRSNQRRNDFVTYLCSNCQESIKTFAIQFKPTVTNNSRNGEILKFGEDPPLGPPTPSKLISLIGPDHDLFLNGRRCEVQGLGIGAFTYYRRVVERQKNRIIGEIRRVAEKIGVQPNVLGVLDAALAENQFKRAFELAREAIPESLLVGGHNPLTLLHSALSDGIHDKTDAACLELATHIRVVLADLSERMAQALKDDAELAKAVAALHARASRTGDKSKTGAQFQSEKPTTH